MSEPSESIIDCDGSKSVSNCPIERFLPTATHLTQTGLHLRRILRSAREYLDDWNYLDSVDIRSFRKGVKELLAYVEQTLATPYEQRGVSPFK